MKLLVIIIFAIILLLSCTDNLIINDFLEDGGEYEGIIEVTVHKENEEPVYYDQCALFRFEDSTFTFNDYSHFTPKTSECENHMNYQWGNFSISDKFNLYDIWTTLIYFPNEYPLGGEYDYRVKHLPLYDSLIMWQTKTIHRVTNGGEFDVYYKAIMKLKKLN